MVVPVHSIGRYQRYQESKGRSGGGSHFARSRAPSIGNFHGRLNDSMSSGGIQRSGRAGLQEESSASVANEGGGFNLALRHPYTPWTPPDLRKSAAGARSSPCTRDDDVSHQITPREPQHNIERTLSERSSVSNDPDCFFLSFGGKQHHDEGQSNENLVKVLSDKTSTWIEELEEKRRRETAEYRISQALIGLKAANERSLDFHSVKLHHDQANADRVAEFSEKKSPLQCLVGDVGVAMFSPLDETAFEPLKLFDAAKETPLTHFEDTASEIESSDEEEYPVEVEPEPLALMKSCPRLLTTTMMQQLVDEALPEIVKTMHWRRIFAIGRDGDAFCTMLQLCSSFKHTIVVVQTSEGDIFGGYATEPWQRQEGHNMGRCFFGSGQSFLFSNHPAVHNANSPDKSETTTKHDDDDHSENYHNSSMNELTVFKWTGNNRYCQVCDVDRGTIAMGGGGAFGLIVEENFSRGGTGHCDTFGNPPLIPSFDERFDISNFEVYGFVPASQSLFTPPSSPVTSW